MGGSPGGSPGGPVCFGKGERSTHQPVPALDRQGIAHKQTKPSPAGATGPNPAHQVGVERAHPCGNACDPGRAQGSFHTHTQATFKGPTPEPRPRRPAPASTMGPLGESNHPAGQNQRGWEGCARPLKWSAPRVPTCRTANSTRSCSGNAGGPKTQGISHPHGPAVIGSLRTVRRLLVPWPTRLRDRQSMAN